MIHYRYLLFIVGIVISSLLIVTTASALRAQQDSRELLKRVVLQKTDFPSDVDEHTFNSDETKLEDFDNQISIVTMPFVAEGFVDAYRVSGWYSLNYENDAFKEASQGVFVENMAFLFEDEEQVTKAYAQQVQELNDNILPALDTITVNDLQSNGLQGKLIQFDHSDEGIDFTTYYLFGVVNNRLLFLMVDGLPDPAVQRAFENLVNKLVSYQSAG